MSLLTPAESRAFQSFLDATAFPTDWSTQLEISHEHMPPAHGTEALTKATKDLMSLDTDKWRYPLNPCSPAEGSVAPAPRQQQAQSHPPASLYAARQQRSLAGDAGEAELLNPPAAHLGASSSHTQLPFYHVINSAAHPDQSRVDPHPSDRSSSSSSSRQSPADLLISSSTARLASSSSSSAKRSPPPDPKLVNKRHRSSTCQNPPDEAQPQPHNRVSLLSPSQKKANHIQSEQKRRANIRRGYDALCETVPALREACQAEDEQPTDGKSKSRRRGKAKTKGDDGERIDGRAGPRSENIVLSKTIDYVHELLSEREALMQRLHAARSALPVGHPLLQPEPDAPLPLWERKWTGGEEKGNDDEDEDEDD